MISCTREEIRLGSSSFFIMLRILSFTYWNFQLYRSIKKKEIGNEKKKAIVVLMSGKYILAINVSMM